MILNSQVGRYALSGAVLNVLGLIFFSVLLQFCNYSLIVSLSISFITINTLYYLSQSLFVFKKKLSYKNLTQFVLNIILIYLVNIILLLILVDLFKFNAVLSQLIILIILVFSNFLIQKKVIFK
jgi:putative flippase GtrA|tara:strand:- start:201 stop:572 length:372 start_codon:yes stop_codon:yes gene_type:complete